MQISEKFLLKISLCMAIVGITILFAVVSTFEGSGIDAAIASKNLEGKRVTLQGQIVSIRETSATTTLLINTNFTAKALIFNDAGKGLNVSVGNVIILSGTPREENNILIIDVDEINLAER